MAHFRLSELHFNAHGSRTTLQGSKQQTDGLAAVIRRITLDQEYDAAFIEFIAIEPSQEWIEAVEAFLDPRPTSHAELLDVCLESLNSKTVDCLKNAQLRDNSSYRDHVDKVILIVREAQSERRVELMHLIQQIMSLATTPQLREDLYLTVATRRNGLQPLSKSIQFARNL
ncbi:hypothetical protein PG999_002883 [Apiospora kogelbergensis]|uniref:Immunity protein 30 n=1 Tax=Apiospora kogelbergensis TaxID=1337665 RepID=A0AAW0R9S5_9PEZI